MRWGKKTLYSEITTLEYLVIPSTIIFWSGIVYDLFYECIIFYFDSPCIIHNIHDTSYFFVGVNKWIKTTVFYYIQYTWYIYILYSGFFIFRKALYMQLNMNRMQITGAQSTSKLINILRKQTFSHIAWGKNKITTGRTPWCSILMKTTGDNRW